LRRLIPARASARVTRRGPRPAHRSHLDRTGAAGRGRFGGLRLPSAVGPRRVPRRRRPPLDSALRFDRRVPYARRDCRRPHHSPNPLTDRIASPTDAWPEAALLTFDPIIRPSIIGSHDAVLPRFEQLASRVDLVKLSDADADWLYPDLDAHAQIDRVLDLGADLIAM